MGIISSILCFPYKDDINMKEMKEEEEIDEEAINITEEIKIIKEENNYSVEFGNENEKWENDIKEKKSSSLKKDLLSLEFFKCLAVAG